MESDGDLQAKKQQLISAEVERIDNWTGPRVIAYRRLRDSWQRVTYSLLGLSAVTAIGAAITAGLSIRLWSVIFAGVSAGLSVISASLKTATQIANSEKSLATFTALGASVRAFKTDRVTLSPQNLEKRLQQLRKEQQEAMRLPDPSEKLLDKASNALDRMPEIKRQARYYRW